LRGKTKSFFEDTFILLIVAVLIYGIYSFFFASEEEVKLEEPKVVIENKVETNTYKEPVVNEIKTPTEIKSEPNNPEKVEEKVIETPKVEAVQKEQIEEQIKEKIEPVKVEPVKVEKPTTETPNVQTTQELEEKAKVEAFYSTIREKIYANINKNVDKSLIKNGEFVSIKLTVLKDGNYEQLTFIEGNKEYFELFRSSIKEAYPVKIDDSLKNNFPRYFRMKIEF
jgi:outer membrane biosynthesis protein TonB